MSVVGGIDAKHNFYIGSDGDAELELGLGVASVSLRDGSCISGGAGLRKVGAQLGVAHKDCGRVLAASCCHGPSGAADELRTQMLEWHGSAALDGKAVATDMQVREARKYLGEGHLDEDHEGHQHLAAASSCDGELQRRQMMEWADSAVSLGSETVGADLQVNIAVRLECLEDVVMDMQVNLVEEDMVAAQAPHGGELKAASSSASRSWRTRSPASMPHVARSLAASSSA